MDDYSAYLQNLIKETLPKYPQAVPKLMNLPLTGPNGVRKLLGEIDLEFFGKAYFQEYFEYESPQFHKNAYVELDAILNYKPSGTRIVRVWPRANAKSTIYNFLTPVQAALYAKRHLIVQVSDTESQAQGFLGDVKNALETNEYLLEDFGDCRGDVWRADMISINAKDQVVWLAAVGAGSGVRGLRKAQFRPDLIIVDDLENDDSVLTPDRINKLYQWFNRALMNLGNKQTDVIVVGTILAYESVLDRLTKSPSWDTLKLAAIKEWSISPLWEEWAKLYTDLSLSKTERMRVSDQFFEDNKEEMLEGTAVLWEENWSYLSLYKKYIDIGAAAFHSEQQNDPINFDEVLFQPDWITYYDDDELKLTRIIDVYGALDPSLGKTRLSDYSAFIVLGRGENGYIYVLDAIVERMNTDKLLETLLYLGETYNFTRFGIEVNQWQDLLRVMFVDKSARQGIYLPIVELRHNKDKVIRVQSLTPYVKNGYIKFKREHRLLMEQLLGFPKLRHDDGPDALEMAIRLVSRYPGMEPLLTGTQPDDDYPTYDDDDDSLEDRHYYS